ncbi:hypothetical protein RO3G_00358 [Rhizopus delemar RA 99-880]|uniref:Uncharacterized protein n=1 Tax=Rhizopus delemar (strain RA 99-880 / ATCC MYA-4621 / FGSC 9543 / NRRL 43880) TaxID=246409 RepID=I1BHH4_RHIO9|nr:hypothetical protein RO3G_00358 [Rhizopus delemar RA 99-880]|eukprot:EIE75654.1 hypothetical protein RO3G_00358 [Rhizopus delemar RA 99-880]
MSISLVREHFRNLKNYKEKRINGKYLKIRNTGLINKINSKHTQLSLFSPIFNSDFETESEAFDHSHREFVALVLDPRSSAYKLIALGQMYQPHDKDWIKDRLIAHFSRQQAPPPPQTQHRRNNRRNY